VKAGARLVLRPAVPGTPLPPLVEFHTAVVHHIGATASRPAPARVAEPDPTWFPWMWIAAIGVAAAASACWKLGFGL